MAASIKQEIITAAVKQALREDVGGGDITSRGLAGRGKKIQGRIFAQQAGVLAGRLVVNEVYHQLSKDVRVRWHHQDGDRLKKGDPVCTLKGPAESLLTGERTALNFLGMLSGIASETSRYVQVVKGTKTKIFDTRKTIPGLRLLVKYAVQAGGGANHRLGLYDGILIKDNHIKLAGSITAAMASMNRANRKKLPVEVEVETLAEVKEALASGADIILLDNFSVSGLKQAIALIGRKAQTEISGGVTLAKLKTYARLGVDRISVGAITHSMPWLSLHLEFD